MSKPEPNTRLHVLLVVAAISAMALSITIGPVVYAMNSPRLRGHWTGLEIVESADCVTPEGRAVAVRTRSTAAVARVSSAGVASYEPSYGAMQIDAPPWWAEVPTQPGRSVTTTACGWPMKSLRRVDGSVDVLPLGALVNSVCLFPVTLAICAGAWWIGAFAWKAARAMI
ncbi:MAG: hypothetical protein IBJ18_09265 [Phycisphaerales bacterium]|nr:hypothetical protein [Phycisphaerales bacterium]